MRRAVLAVVALLLTLAGGAGADGPPSGPATGTVWSPTTLPNGRVGVPYQVVVAAKPPGGATATSVYCYCSPSARKPPPGLKATDLHSSWRLAGTPTEEGLWTFELRDVFTDASGAAWFGQQSFEIRIEPAETAKPKTPPPTTAAARCKCASVDAHLSGFEVLNGIPSFELDWSIACTGGAGDRCAGEIDLTPPKGNGEAYRTRFTRVQRKGVDAKPVPVPGAGTQLYLTCSAPCHHGAHGSARLFAVGERWTSAAQRANRPWHVVARLACADDRKNGISKDFLLWFDPHGLLDKENSDLSGMPG